jgi:hypothetical protein
VKRFLDRSSVEYARQREYLSQAAECERSTAETLDPIAAKTYRDMARRWRELAQQTSSAFTLVSP